jgi:Domain of unknown function (DUF4185)/CARDB
MGWRRRGVRPVACREGERRGDGVPVEGIRADGKTYVFFVTGFDGADPPVERFDCTHPQAVCTYSHRVLGHFDEDTMRTGRFVRDQTVKTSRFLNVSAVKYDHYVYLFGAGNPYRKSAVRLARFRPQAIDRVKQWRYFRRRNHWVQGANHARPIVRDAPRRCVGELSVRRDPKSGYFLMAYNCKRRPRRWESGTGPWSGYYLRVARRPWGPWSDPILMFDGSPDDGGYGITQHLGTGSSPDDGLAEADHLSGPDKWRLGGDEYGPYLIPRFFRWGACATRCPLRSKGRYLSIVYTHSSWNPYKVHLMRTVLEPPRFRVRRPERGAGRPPPTVRNGSFDDGLNGWQQSGMPLRVVTLQNRHYVSSYVPQGPGEENGDDVQGTLYQDFTLDNRTTALCFRIHGGSVSPTAFQTRAVAAVRLYHDNEIVRESFGWNGDVYQNVRWDIREFAGEPLRLEIADHATGSWGFIDATGFSTGDCAPDLVVEGIRGLGVGNHPLTVSVDVRNAGDADAPVSKLFLALEQRQTGQRREYLLDTPPLGPGASTTVRTTCAPYASNSATATADTGNAITESDETNNTLTRTGEGCHYP